MPPSVREYFWHILAETAFLMQSSASLDKTVFMQDEVLKRAYVRSIEIIGEAVKQIPDHIRNKYPSIE